MDDAVDGEELTQQEVTISAISASARIAISCEPDSRLSDPWTVSKFRSHITNITESEGSLQRMVRNSG